MMRPAMAWQSSRGYQGSVNQHENYGFNDTRNDDHGPEGGHEGGTIDELIASLTASGRINDPVLFKEMILKREAESSTGIGAASRCRTRRQKRLMNRPSCLPRAVRAWISKRWTERRRMCFYDRSSGRSRKYPSPHACRTIAAADRYRIYRTIDEYEDAREVTALFDSKQAVEEAPRRRRKRPREGKRQKGIAEGAGIRCHFRI